MNSIAASQGQLRLPRCLIIDPDLGITASGGDMAALRVHSQSAHLIPVLLQRLQHLSCRAAGCQSGRPVQGMGEDLVPCTWRAGE